MSDAKPVLGERDEALWEAIGDGDVDAAGLSRDELVVAVEELAEAFREYRAETDRELAKLHNRISDVGRKADGNLAAERSTTLGKYASMGEENHRELLGTTDRLAVAIYEHWDELAENFPNGARGVSTRRNSTRKYNPSRIKRELEERVPTDLPNRDGELPWEVTGIRVLVSEPECQFFKNAVDEPELLVRTPEVARLRSRSSSRQDQSNPSNSARRSAR